METIKALPSCIVIINGVEYINLAYEAFVKLEMIDSIYVEHLNSPFLDNYIITLNNGKILSIAKMEGMNIIAEIVNQFK